MIFSDLRDYYSKEYRNAGLQELPHDFMDSLSSYLAEDCDLFEHKNKLNVAEELLELRIGKIVNLAYSNTLYNKVSDDISLLPNERVLFDNIVGCIDDFKKLHS